MDLLDDSQLSSDSSLDRHDWNDGSDVLLDLEESGDYYSATSQSSLQPSLLDDSLDGEDDASMQLMLPLDIDTTSHGHSIISKIEQIFEGHVDVLLGHSAELAVELRTRSRRLQTYKFPGSTVREAWRFAVVLRLLELIHEALASNVVWTKRDLYYRDPLLFTSQAVVDRYVDDIARTFETSRAGLNISAAAKGLIAGPVTIWQDGEIIIDGLSARSGTLIRHISGPCRIDMEAVNCILVVEKEACFRSLVESVFWTSIERHAILVTAKGYPDIASRALLNMLSTPSAANSHKHCPLYGLFDCDPDGLRILATYKHSTATLVHETAALACPTLQWLGLKTGQLRGEAAEVDMDSVLLRLTPRDRRHATLMLGRRACEEGGEELEWRCELQRMLMLNKKAEMQLLEQCEGGLAGWLRRRGF